MKTGQARAALAAAIDTRNEAAKAVKGAEDALAEVIGTPTNRWHQEARNGAKLDELRSKLYRAEESIEEVEAQKREADRLYMGNRTESHKHFMRLFDGKTYDELLTERKGEEESARRQYAALEVARDKLAFVVDEAEAHLERAKTNVGHQIDQVFMSEVVDRLTRECVAETLALLQKIGALTFLTRSVNFQHRDVHQPDHPMYATNDILSMFERFGAFATWQRKQAYDAARNEGALPWQAARSRLEVDADAPLPTDLISPKTAKAA